MIARHIFGRGRQPDQYLLDGREVTKEEYDRALPDKPMGGQAPCFFKPLESDALAVHPDQVKEATADAARKGVPTDFLADGRPVLRTRKHRAAYLKAYGFFDRDAGYGDPADGSSRGPDRPRPQEY